MREGEASAHSGAASSWAALSPLSFLERSADVWADRPAVKLGDRVWTYREHADRVGRAAAALVQRLSVRAGDRVAVILPNVPAMLELHYAVPGVGAVLVPLNTRLSGAEYEYVLAHSGAGIVFADSALRGKLETGTDLRVVWVEARGGEGCEYEAMVEASDSIPLRRPDDERSLLSINYTSGTTGRPKGVMAIHRGSYLQTMGVIAEAGLRTDSVYLWTLPMFHCNGWAYIWAVTAAGALHVCLPTVDVSEAWAEIDAGATHLCAAPTVLGMIMNADHGAASAPVKVFVGGAAPAPTMLERAERLNFDLTHLYGLTETYGPIVVSAWNPAWSGLPDDRRFALMARQGVATIVGEPLRVVDSEMRDVPRDGRTVGEIVMRGNNVTTGYYLDPEATAAAFAGGWFHSGDLAVMHPDGFVEISDRLKDVVISGGENIASIEVERALVAHDRIEEAAVFGVPDDRWGEIAVAHVTLSGEAPLDLDQVSAFLRERIARFKVPKQIVVVDELPKTATGKIQKHLLRDASRRP